MTDEPSNSTLLGQAVSHLVWLTTSPHSIEHVVLVACENERARLATAARAKAATKGEGRIPLGYSDPTPRALDIGAAADSEAARSIDAALVNIDESCTELYGIVAGVIEVSPWRPLYVGDRGDLLTGAIGCLGILVPVVDDVATLTAHAHGRIDHLVRSEISGSASWLRTKAEAVLEEAPTWARSEVVQRPPKYCTSCARFGLEVHVERYATKCRRCGDFFARERVQPNRTICEMWDRLGDGARVTPTMILAAKAEAKRPKSTRRRAG